MNASDHETAAELTETLAPIYQLLGQLYLEPPTERRVEQLRSLCAELDDPSLPPELAEAVETVRTASVDLDELKGAFTRLLQGVSFGGAVAPPYESLYLDGVLNGPSSTEVEAFYQGAGVELAVDDELIDHAGYELAFLGELCASGDTERQHAFVRTHLGSWIVDYHDEARGTEPPAFYRGVFALTESLIELHAETLEHDDE